MNFDPSETVVQTNCPTIGHDFKLMSTGNIFDEETRKQRNICIYYRFENSLIKNTFAKYGEIGLRWFLEPKLSKLAQKTTGRMFKNRLTVLNYLFVFPLASNVKV